MVRTGIRLVDAGILATSYSPLRAAANTLQCDVNGASFNSMRTIALLFNLCSCSREPTRDRLKILVALTQEIRKARQGARRHMEG